MGRTDEVLIVGSLDWYCLVEVDSDKRLVGSSSGDCEYTVKLLLPVEVWVGVGILDGKSSVKVASLEV